jgi:hypothetical protein
VEHTSLAAAPADFIRSPLGIAALMIVTTVSGGFIRDRLATEGRDTTSIATVQALEKRVDLLQAEQSDYQHGALTALVFTEFRTANDKRLDDLRTDMRDLIAEVNSADHLRVMNRK